MLICKNCGYEGIFNSHACPRCHFPSPRDNEEIAKLRLSLKEAERNRDNKEKALIISELISLGDPYGELALAKMYEAGDGVQRNIDTAMEHYRLGAIANDGECAYRYSRLVSRMNSSLSSFWLTFSAELGYTGAYIDAAEYYRDNGNEELYLYYLSKAELCDDVDARAKLIEFYAADKNSAISERYAKWYLDKFAFPPFNILKLSYKLRSVKPIEPEAIRVDRIKLLNNLLDVAKGLELKSSIVYLAEKLFELGDKEAPLTLAAIYISADGVDRDINKGINILKASTENKNADSAMALGLFYMTGEVINADFELALHYLNLAVEYGREDAYLYIADIYHNKSYKKRDLARAYELYLLADKAGAEGAREKAEKIARLREDYFKRAIALECKGEFTKELYKYYGVSAIMGHSLGALKLAECYALGRGVRKNRREAFRWYNIAKDRGVKEAYLPIGVCYSRGLGTRFNYDKALHFLSLASGNKDNRAERELSRLLARRDRGVSNKIYSKASRLIYLKKYTLAKGVLDIAYALGHARATYLLGCLYEFGRGTATNKTRAYELYREASSRGFTDERAKYKSVILRLVKRL